MTRVGRAGRIEIHTIAATDQHEFVAAMRASRALHQPWLSAAETPAAFQLLVERARHENFVSLLARRRDSGELVGFFNLSQIIRGSLQSCFLGYGGVVGQTGEGLMSEALQLVLAHAFGPLKLHRVEANIQPSNAPSIALVRRAGFVREGFSERYLKINGRWRDHERWAIRSEQWRQRGTPDSIPQSG